MENFKEKVKEIHSTQNELKSKYQEQIITDKEEILGLLEKGDKKSGKWFLKLYNKVLSSYSKNINYDYFEKKYSSHQKDVIIKKIIKSYCNYNTAVGVVIGGGGGFFGLPGGIISAFPETALVSYNLLKMIFDISIIYDKKIDIDDPLEATRILMLSFGIKGNEIANTSSKVVISKGGQIVTKEVSKRVALRSLQKVLEKIGIKVTQKSLKALLAKAIPVVGAFLGAGVCGAMDYFATKSISNKAVFYYRTGDVLINEILINKSKQNYSKILFLKFKMLDYKCNEIIIRCASCFENLDKVVPESKSLLFDLLITEFSAPEMNLITEKHRVKYFIDEIIEEISLVRRKFIFKKKFNNFVKYLLQVMSYFIIADMKVSKSDILTLNMISVKFLDKEFTKDELKRDIEKFIILWVVIRITHSSTAKQGEKREERGSCQTLYEILK